MADAAFHFDAQASLLKKSIAAGGTTTAALDDTTGVSSVLWTVVAAYNSSTSDWSLSTTAGTSTVVTAPSGSAKSCLLQCKVNGGVYVDQVTGRQQSGGQTIRTAKIYIAPETIVTGETTESNATDGWAPIVNASIVATSGTTALSGTALNLSEGGDSLSLTRSGSNLWLMTAGTGDSIKIDSAANITLDVGGATGTIDLTHADVSTCALVLDSDGPLTCTVGQAVTSVTFGQTQKTSGAGADWTVRAQRGQAGFAGGDLNLSVGDGGTTGTNAPGDINLTFGTPVAGAAGKLSFQVTGTGEVGFLQQVAANFHRFSFPGGSALLQIIGGAQVDVTAPAVSLTSGSASGAITATVNGTERFRANNTGIGFNASAPIAKPTITGSRGGNAALASLLTQLALYGLITDGTTA